MSLVRSLVRLKSQLLLSSRSRMIGIGRNGPTRSHDSVMGWIHSSYACSLRWWLWSAVDGCLLWMVAYCEWLMSTPRIATVRRPALPRAGAKLGGRIYSKNIVIEYRVLEYSQYIRMPGLAIFCTSHHALQLYISWYCILFLPWPHEEQPT